jgi:hypothetical protein
VYVTAVPAGTLAAVEVMVVTVTAWTVDSVVGTEVLGSRLAVPEKIERIARAPSVVNVVVHDALPAATATEPHPLITALSAVNATVPPVPDGVTVALSVTVAEACAVPGVTVNVVVEVVVAAIGVIVMVPLPLWPAPRKLVERALEVAHDDPPPPPAALMLSPIPSAPPPPP